MQALNVKAPSRRNVFKAGVRGCAPDKRRAVRQERRVRFSPLLDARKKRQAEARSGFTIKAPSSGRPPAWAYPNERRNGLFSKGETGQILSDAFTRRFYESFAEGPVSVEQRHTGGPIRAGNQRGARLGAKYGSGNGHHIGYSSASLDINADGASGDRDSDAAAGVTYAELQCRALAFAIKVRLSA